MFKAHIFVRSDTDVAAELDKIEKLAIKHDLDQVKMFALMRDAEVVLADLKRQDTETAAFGIKMAVTKSLATEDYRIVFELRPRKDSAKRGVFSALFRR
jgi:hypothetical protein